MPKSCVRIVDNYRVGRGNGLNLYSAIHNTRRNPVYETAAFPHIPQFFPLRESTVQGQLFNLLIVGLSTVCTALIIKTIQVYFFSFY